LVLEPSRDPSAEGVRADVLVGVPADPDRLAATEAALAAQASLRDVFPSLVGRAVVLTDQPQGAVSPGEPLPAAAQGGGPAAVYTGGRLGPETALPTLLETALALGAPACALVEARPRGPGAEWMRLLVGPVVEHGFDLVSPAYRHGKLEGLLNSGLAYPLTRALFGARILQPLGREIALSARAAEQLLRDEEWRTDPAHAGADLWVITKALAREIKVCQSFLGPRPPAPGPQPDVAQSLARMLRTVFHEMEQLAPRWQRVRASAPVETFGDAHFPVERAHQPSVGQLVSAFALGWRDLRPLWSAVLPPYTLLSLQRLPCDPPEAFRLADALWARIVYDFAVAWRQKVMDRNQLLLSMTPLYMGWAASWANEVGPLDAAATEERLERLCQAFELEKPYLISRWRWPERFSP
jgi:hypothetical protein